MRLQITKITQENLEIIESSDEIIQLADSYISSGILTEKSREDALHIATATVNKIDVIVSWNFKHIVNLDKIRKYNYVNLLNRYNLIEIRTPMEVINYE